MSLYVGEALAGDGNEVAHIDLMIGSKDGPVGIAFANALSTQSSGHSNLLAVLAPNVAVKPSTVMVTKVTIKGAKQAVQMFGPAQAAVAKAVADCVADGIIPEDQAESLVIVCGVFIHWQAEDNEKIYNNNYQATKDSIIAAMTQKPTAAEMIAQKDSAYRLRPTSQHVRLNRRAGRWGAATDLPQQCHTERHSELDSRSDVYAWANGSKKHRRVFWW